MRIIALRTLRDFWEQHADSAAPLRAWYFEARQADWDSPAAVKAKYGSASIVGNNRVVFNIKGNSYRLVVKINYPTRIVYIRFLGTHVEYDRIDAEEV
jgi:mRNA interferase HigB